MVLTPLIILVGFAAFLAFAGIRVLQEYERGVVFRFGRYAGVKEAGIRWIIPMVDRLVKVSLREIVMDVPPQEVITRDNVSVKVNAVIYFRVLHPEKAVIQVENYLYGTSQLSQTTLRSVCGQAELDELLAERESINRQLQEIIDLQTEPWGVKNRSTFPATCSGPWPSRPRLSARSARRSSMPLVSPKPPSAWVRPPRFWPRSRSRFSFATCRRCPRLRPSTAPQSYSQFRSIC